MTATRRALLATAILAPVAARAQPAAPAMRDAIRRAVTEHILPRHGAFAAAARDFAAATARVEAAGPEPARAAWMGSEADGRDLEGGGAIYRTPQDGLLVPFKSLHGGLEFLGERQVARPLGPSPAEAFLKVAVADRGHQVSRTAQKITSAVNCRP